MLDSTLRDAQTEQLTLTIHALIAALVKVLMESEIETNFPLVLPAIISNFSSALSTIRRSAKQTIEAFLKKTHNLEIIIPSLITIGLQSVDENLRSSSLGASLRFIDAC